MIEYVVKNNVDDRIISRAVNILNENGLVAYPTDTSWGIGCSSRSKEGIVKLLALKGDPKYYTVTLMCHSISQVSDITELSSPNFRFIKRYIPGPYVFILPALKSVEKKINMKRSEIGIRIPNNEIPTTLSRRLDAPLLSVSASRKMTETGWWSATYAEENLFDYGYELEDIPGIGLIIDTGEAMPKILSTVINLTSGEFEVVRKGAGEL